ncbi:MAG: DUF2442 domain-containing protein [Candidatus Kapabacteria bacterium]|nr:DUF2442 domain-containing protein [Candidatus Kapabacteria bacterium]
MNHDYHILHSAESLPDYRVRVVFNDGVSGDISFASDIGHGVFARIANPQEFSKVIIEQYGTVLTWDIDAPELERPDACADWLYQQLQLQNTQTQSQ